jgi:hypothetical protein
MSSFLDRSTPVYRAVSGRVLMYQGLANVTVEGVDRSTDCEIRLDVGRGRLSVHLASDEVWLTSLIAETEELPVTIPEGSSLDLADDPIDTIDRRQWSWDTFLNRKQAGDLTAATGFVIHVRGNIPSLRRPVDFSLPGWRLRLVELSPSDDAYSHIVNAVPTAGEAAAYSFEGLRKQLHAVLGLVAGQQVAIGAVAGLDGDGRIRWADWCVGRGVHDRARVSWCTEPVVESALTQLAIGYTRLSDDPALVTSVERAIGYYLSASGGGDVLDIRVPVACIGLEILGWALLQKRGWIGPDALSKMPEGAVARVLLRSCGIPTDSPPNFNQLIKRRKAFGQPGWAGPEVVFEIRNKLVHPPSKLDKPTWPDSECLLEAWLLSTWYLELALLHTLGYKGDYWSRLRLGRNVWSVEPVPWQSVTDYEEVARSAEGSEAAGS